MGRKSRTYKCIFGARTKKAASTKTQKTVTCSHFQTFAPQWRKHAQLSQNTTHFSCFGIIFLFLFDVSSRFRLGKAKGQKHDKVTISRIVNFLPSHMKKIHVFGLSHFRYTRQRKERKVQFSYGVMKCQKVENTTKPQIVELLTFRPIIIKAKMRTQKC